MAKDYRDVIADIDEYAAELKALVPEPLAAFGQLGRAAQAAGALDRKTKQLIALAIAAVVRCDGCIGYHARAARKEGATRQEAAEALGVAIQMGGGPAVNAAADALRAFDQFGPEPG